MASRHLFAVARRASIRADDPIYGQRPPQEDTAIYLGRLELLGERGLLAVPTGDLLRLRFNPFYPYVERRILAFIEEISTAKGEASPAR